MAFIYTRQVKKIIFDSKCSKRRICPTSPMEVLPARSGISTPDLSRPTYQRRVDSGMFVRESSSGSHYNSSLSEDVEHNMTSMKSYPCQIGTTALFRLTSVPNAGRQGEIYHIITSVHESAVSHFKKYDRIVHVNGDDIKDKDGEHVQTILSDLRNDVVERNKLNIWRWCEGDDSNLIKQIEIELHSFDKNGQAQSRKSYHQSLENIKRQRKVWDLEWTSEPKLYHIRIGCEEGDYIFADIHTRALGGAKIMDRSRPIDQFRFLLRTFRCMLIGPDQTPVIRFGIVISYENKGQMYDVSSNIQAFSNSINLKPRTRFSTTNPDERFFILYEVQGGEDVFESLLYENMCIEFDKDLGRLMIKELGMSKPKTKRSFITPRPKFIFQSYSLKTINHIISENPDTLFTGQPDTTCDCFGLPIKKKSLKEEARRNEQINKKCKRFEFEIETIDPNAIRTDTLIKRNTRL